MHLKRDLNLFDTVSIVIGAIVGAGIFVLTGIASSVAGPSLILSVIIAGFVALLTSISIAELVVAFPKEGGEYEYGYKTLSPFAGFVSGWMWTLNKIVAGSVLALGFATYLSVFFIFLPVKLVGIGLIVLVTFINYLGIRRVGTIIDLLVIAKLSILLIFVIVGLPYFKTSNFYPFAPFGIKGILQAAGIIFFAYVGFARPVYLVEEIKNPAKNVPKGIFIGLLISAAIYILITGVAIGLVGTDVLGKTDSPLAVAMGSTGLQWASVLITLGALLATFSVLLDDNLGLSRMIFAMGRKGDYPKWLGTVEKSSNSPRTAIILTGTITAATLILFDLRNLAQVASFFILVYFAMVNLSATKLKIKKRKFSMIIPVLGLMGTLSLAFSLPVEIILIGLAIIFLGVVYFYLKESQFISPSL